ncbi:MAG: hypothetical protein GF350_11360 [Chitinivibrionales bacterium]|nr:hypothetical protein [Chitinivibrionales bacterium]
MFSKQLSLLFCIAVVAYSPNGSSGPSGVIEDSTLKCNWIARDKDFVKDRFFFLDSLYKRAFIRTYCPESPSDIAVPKIRADNFQVWKTALSRAVKPSDSTEMEQYCYVKNSPRDIIYKKLDPGAYYVDWSEGWIWFDTLSVYETDIIGIFMETENSTLIPAKGDTTLLDSLVRGKFSILKSLWLLKDETRSVDTTGNSFKLMWKNVYRIPRCYSGMRIEVCSITGRGDTIPFYKGTRISAILGLTDEYGIPIDDPGIFDYANGLLFVPPFDCSDNGLYPFLNPALGEVNIQRDLYKLNPANPQFEKKPVGFVVRGCCDD